MSNTPSKAEIEALVKRHGATSYRNRADTQHPAYGFTEDGLNGLIDEVLAKWGTPQPVVREPLTDREIDLIDGMIQVQLDHASRFEAIANRSIADKQKGWDMERVALLQKLKAHGIKGDQHGTE